MATGGLVPIFKIAHNLKSPLPELYSTLSGFLSIFGIELGTLILSSIFNLRLLNSRFPLLVIAWKSLLTPYSLI